ncbi:hypothetical protein PEC302107_14940 [Pectobacterium araliae]|nr:hypothetical protein PEC302107_14940 [Pectobacterium carotovorum subsp. carotovorum]
MSPSLIRDVAFTDYVTSLLLTSTVSRIAVQLT